MTSIESELCGPEQLAQPSSVLQSFYESAVRYPDNIALICSHQPSDLYDISDELETNTSGCHDPAQSSRYLRWTYENLQGGVERLVVGLSALGTCTGRAIITLLPNCAESCLIWWAALELGAIVAPLDPRRLSNLEEGRHMVQTIVEATAGQDPIFIALRPEYLENQAIASTQTHARVLVSSNSDVLEHDWIPFAQLMKDSRTDANPKLRKVTEHGEPPQDCLILFTSGTTALPKGVRHSALALAVWATDDLQPSEFQTQPGDSWVVPVPNNHAAGIFSMVQSSCKGACLVYPGPAFATEQVTRMLKHEKCTHLVLVPAMLELLMQTIDKGQFETGLKLMLLAGSGPSKKQVQACFDTLKTRGVCCAYGSTEGVLTLTHVTSSADDMFDNDGKSSIGLPQRGCRTKICAHESRRQDRMALPRNVPGEIDFSGPFLRPSLYCGVDGTDSCYTDKDGRLWFATGDQGVVDANGKLYMVGRYKDMIKRAGETIAPSAIEKCLADHLGLSSEQVQIVGHPDKVAGEVPVAVVKELPAFTPGDLQRTILRQMGPMWNVQEVIELKELGLSDWPRTPLERIKRPVLRELLAQRYQQQLRHNNTESGSSDAPLDMIAESPLQQRLLHIWSRTVGLSEERIPMDDPVWVFADSVTVARVLGSLRREVPGLHDLRLSDFNRHDTIRKQLTYLDTVLDESARDRDTAQCPTGPPDMSEMVHLVGKPAVSFEATKSLIERTLKPSGFTWEDVVNVYPAQSFVADNSKNRLLDTTRHHVPCVAKKENSLQRVKTAFKSMLHTNEILASFLVWNTGCHGSLDPGLALHVTLNHGEKLYNAVLHDAGSVETVEDLKHLAHHHPHPTWALLPGILFQVLFYSVHETGTIGFIMSVSHSVMDAYYTQMFLADLDHALGLSPLASLSPHTDYKLWAESYYSFQESPQARASVAWQADYLADAHKHFEMGAWPPVSARPTFDPTGKGYSQPVRLSFRVPDLVIFRKHHSTISAPVIVKCALALLNVRRTNHDFAVFATLQAGRAAWPFLPASFHKSKALRLFEEATDVAGPTLSSVLSIVNISPQQTVLGLLRQVQSDQDLSTQHAHAPWADIEELLDFKTKARQHKGLLSKVFATQIFNWVPGMGAQRAGASEPYESMSVLESVTRPHFGLVVRAGLGGLDNDEFFLRLHGDALTEGEMGDVCQELEKNVRWLLRPDVERTLEGWSAKADSKT